MSTSLRYEPSLEPLHISAKVVAQPTPYLRESDAGVFSIQGSSVDTREKWMSVETHQKGMS